MSSDERARRSTKKRAVKRVTPAKARSKGAAKTASLTPKRPTARSSDRGPRAITVALSDREVSVYAGVRVSRALQEITEQMPIYQGVRLAQVLEAVYEQGRKDGARHAFESVEAGLQGARSSVPHRNPGRPRKRS